MTVIQQIYPVVFHKNISIDFAMSYFSNPNQSATTAQQLNQLSFPSYNQNLRSGLNTSPNQDKHLESHAAKQTPLPLTQNQQNPQNRSEPPSTNLNATDSEVPKKRERRNRPGQRFGAKKKSWVWTWFVQDSRNPNVAACDFCGKVITRLPSDKGSPKKLSEHLKTHRLTKETINQSRPVPIDGNGVTYDQNGARIMFNQHNNPQTNLPEAQLASPNTGASAMANPASQHQAPTGMAPLKPEPINMSYNFNQHNRRFLSTEFDNTPYSTPKFHKHILKFLTENKLLINVIKSHSFQQLIYDLRSDSVNELNELTNLYGTLLEVSRFEGRPVPSIEETNIANTIAQAVEQKGSANMS